jgi:hypothetical protein
MSKRPYINLVYLSLYEWDKKNWARKPIEIGLETELKQEEKTALKLQV